MVAVWASGKESVKLADPANAARVGLVAGVAGAAVAIWLLPDLAGFPSACADRLFAHKPARVLTVCTYSVQQEGIRSIAAILVGFLFGVIVALAARAGAPNRVLMGFVVVGVAVALAWITPEFVPLPGGTSREAAIALAKQDLVRFGDHYGDPGAPDETRLIRRCDGADRTVVGSCRGRWLWDIEWFAAPACTFVGQPRQTNYVDVAVEKDTGAVLGGQLGFMCPSAGGPG
jgi:hypothetical protein